MVRFISNVLAKVFRHRDIVIDDELYLRRVFLTPRSWPLRVFLHFIFRPDEGKWLHDHPWDFWSLTLWGGYDEMRMLPADDPPDRHLLDSRIYRLKHNKLLPFLPFVWIKYPAETRHRVVMDHIDGPKTTVTLLFVKQASREWGFFPHDDDRWVHWREHLGLTPVPRTYPLRGSRRPAEVRAG